MSSIADVLRGMLSPEDLADLQAAVVYAKQRVETGIETVTSGAISVHKRTSLISIDSTKAYSLANGLYEGQRKTLYCVAAGNTPAGTITPATFADGATIAMNAVADMVELEWHATGGWRVVTQQSVTVS
jgi:hypothetical protein